MAYIFINPCDKIEAIGGAIFAARAKLTTTHESGLKLTTPTSLQARPIGYRQIYRNTATGPGHYNFVYADTPAENFSKFSQLNLIYKNLNL